VVNEVEKCGSKNCKEGMPTDYLALSLEEAGLEVFLIEGEGW